MPAFTSRPKTDQQTTAPKSSFSDTAFSSQHATNRGVLHDVTKNDKNATSLTLHDFGHLPIFPTNNQEVPPAAGGSQLAASSRFLSGQKLPVWLQIDLGLHNSPPATGPGSRSEPLVEGTASTQAVSTLRTDAWYRSPVNPDNPVLVWTDGTKMFFGPSGAATSGQNILPDATFSPLPGYTPVELQWDRLTGFTVGGGPLMVIARNAAEPDAEDLVVSINDNLAQDTNFTGLGVTSGGSRHVTREGAEFIRSYSSRVPLALSEATASGAIHATSFPDGFLRYRGCGGSDDLYMARGANPAVYLVERSTGAIRRTFAGNTVHTVVPLMSGVVGVETTTGSGTARTMQTVSIDLRTSPATETTSTGHASAEPGYDAVRTHLEGWGVTFEEEGIRFRLAELEAVEQALTLGGNRGLTVLQTFHSLPGNSRNPFLLLDKKIGPEYGGGDTSIGATLYVQEPFDAPADERQATVRHEMTHIIMQATDAVAQRGLSAADRTTREQAMQTQATEGVSREAAGRAQLGERRAGDPAATPSTTDDWRSAVGYDPDMAAIFLDLLEPRPFLPDSEGTGERRGVSLADESRHSSIPSATGHPSDNVGEFVASFVTSAIVYRTAFEAAVLAAETAGNAGGASAGTDLRRLYQRAWTRIDALYVPLGTNPF